MRWSVFAAEGIYSLETACVLDVCFEVPTQHCKHFATCSLHQSLRRKWSSCVHTDQSFHVRREHAGMCNVWDNEAVKGSCKMNDQTTRFSENNICESISWILSPDISFKHSDMDAFGWPLCNHLQIVFELQFLRQVLTNVRRICRKILRDFKSNCFGLHKKAFKSKISSHCVSS
jgi:hypothetical protein